MNAFSLHRTKSLPVWLAGDTAGSYTPKNLHHWLTDTGSLTTRLSQAFQAELTVNILEQDWGIPDTTELNVLGMTAHQQRYVIRRVQLVLNGTPRIYARSIFPENCLTLQDKHIHKLGETPLGKWLFTHPELIRGPFEITQIKGALLPDDAGAVSEQVLWGRRSIFSLNHQQPILVTEYFLTDMPESTHNQTPATAL